MGNIVDIYIIMTIISIIAMVLRAAITRCHPSRNDAIILLLMTLMQIMSGMFILINASPYTGVFCISLIPLILIYHAYIIVDFMVTNPNNIPDGVSV